MAGCGGWGGTLLCDPGITNYIVATPQAMMQFTHPPPPPQPREDKENATASREDQQGVSGVQLRPTSVGHSLGLALPLSTGMSHEQGVACTSAQLWTCCRCARPDAVADAGLAEYGGWGHGWHPQARPAGLLQSDAKSMFTHCADALLR